MSTVVETFDLWLALRAKAVSLRYHKSGRRSSSAGDAAAIVHQSHVCDAEHDPLEARPVIRGTGTPARL